MQRIVSFVAAKGRFLISAVIVQIVGKKGTEGRVAGQRMQAVFVRVKVKMVHGVKIRHVSIALFPLGRRKLYSLLFAFFFRGEFFDLIASGGTGSAPVDHQSTAAGLNSPELV